MSSSDRYKREIMKDLAAGNKEILEPNGNDATNRCAHDWQGFVTGNIENCDRGFCATQSKLGKFTVIKPAGLKQLAVETQR